MRLGRTHRIALRIALGLVLAAGVAVLGRWLTGNLGTVEPGAYRSAQLWPSQLGKVVRQRGVRTVLNLRGRNLDQRWYQDEVRVTLANGATHIDVPIATDHWLTREEARSLVGLLDACPRPLLIHCQWGAERTGLASAFLTLLRPGGTLADARAQFSAAYLFLPTRDGLVMRGHLDQYEGWLKSHRLAHSPDQFRRWVARDYRPGTPSREDWPCNPYPLRIVLEPRPDGSPRATEVWPVDRCPAKIMEEARGERSRR